ncbi:polymer-forming cytoskeletal protein [bacterium]|nr:polymer-forming cytoskeletal protein [bacterium]
MGKRNGEYDFKRPSNGEITTLVGNDAELRGSITTKGSIRIDGSVIGEISSPDTVTVGGTGSVEGNISAENIVIGGHIKGTLTARSRVTLESTARLEGDLITARLVIIEGAIFCGKSNMGDNKKSPQPTSTFANKILEPEAAAKKA